MQVEMEVAQVQMHVVIAPLLRRFVLVLCRVSSSVLEAVAFDDRIQRLTTECCHSCAIHGLSWHLDNDIAVVSP